MKICDCFIFFFSTYIKHVTQTHTHDDVYSLYFDVSLLAYHPLTVRAFTREATLSVGHTFTYKITSVFTRPGSGVVHTPF